MTENNKQKFFEENKLDDMISHYLNEIDSFWEDEEYKWQAVQHFQKHWDVESKDFAEMLRESTSKHLNLLGSGNYFPIGVLLDIANSFPEELSFIFKNLYDEELDLIQRIKDYQKNIKEIYKKTSQPGKNTYQDLRAVSVLLWLRYPDKYYIYKSTELKNTFKLLGGTAPKLNGKAECFPEFLKYMNDLSAYFLGCNTFKEKLTAHINNNSLYEDKSMHIATVDFVFYVGKRYNPILNNSNQDNQNDQDMKLINNPLFEEYKFFILNCTNVEASVRNYTDFKRINNCIKDLDNGKKSVLDYDDPIEFEQLMSDLDQLESYQEINANGGNQYANALKYYLRFLKARKYFSTLKINSINNSCVMPRQVIYYGAPGTGKSNTIKREVEDAGKRHHRTTFHPDSDYSTFVGAYKPAMVKRNQVVIDYEGMVDKLKEYLDEEPVNITRACTLFGHDYHDSIVKMQESVNHTIPDLVADAYKSGTTYDTQVRAGMSLYESASKNNQDSIIVYKFIPQSFTNAYVDAWNTEKEVYLIIEEINRGNCAQIFGDLFQLLDRKNGISEYPIDADSDLEDYLRDKLKDSSRTDFPEGVKEGKKLVLPSNLYIWATMNTSDQSLFPIDSAFKRRWEWKYIPIKNHPEENYKIEIGESKYDWWDFLEKINKVINTTTSSEDKKLGYFFANAENKVIKDEQFVGKVLFYLWNDVFKNYGFDNPIFDKADKDKLAFSDFFNADGNPNHESVNLFLKNLGLEAKEQASDGGKGSIAVVYNGERIQLTNAKETYVEIIKKAINDKGVQQVADVIGSELTQNKQGETRRYVEITSGWYLATNIGIDKIKTNLNKLKDGLNVELEIEDIPIETEA